MEEELPYKITQTFDFLTIQIPLDTLKQKPSSKTIQFDVNEVRIEDLSIPLQRPTYPHESNWYVDRDEGYLYLELAKQTRYWWPDVIGEDGTTTIPPRKFHELNDEEKQVTLQAHENRVNAINTHVTN